MKRKLLGSALLLGGCILATACVTTERVYVQPAPQPAPAPQEMVRYGAEDEPFYEDLAPHGEWVHVSGPGWVWYPYRVPAGWRPYGYGRWVYTDYGWTWSSEETYGWVVYHYGRWYDHPEYGWVWVPGTEWGPAWVAWHEGGGYVGWAPLPWQVTWHAGIGLDWGNVNINVALGPSAWYFVRDRDLVAPNLRGCIVAPARNVTLIRNTVHVTNYVYVDNRIVDRSVRKEKIGRAVGHTIPSYRVRRSESPDEGRGGKVKGQEFVVFRRDPGRGPQRRDVPPGHDGRQPRDNDSHDRSEDRERGPQRRDVPPGHDGQQRDDDAYDRSEDRGRGRRTTQPGHDAYPPQKDADRDRTATPDEGDDKGNKKQQPGRGSEPQHGPRSPRYSNPPQGDGNDGQQQRRPQGTGTTRGNPADGSRTNPPAQNPSQGSTQGETRGQGGNGGSVTTPPSGPPAQQAKPGNSGKASKPAPNKPNGKGKGKKPAPPDPKQETKPEESTDDSKKDDSGSGS
jgi:hypothetical protein